MPGSNEIRVVNLIMLHLRCGIKPDIYNSNETLDHKLNKKTLLIESNKKERVHHGTLIKEV